MLRGLLVVEYRCGADELSVVSVAARAGGPVVLCLRRDLHVVFVLSVRPSRRDLPAASGRAHPRRPGLPSCRTYRTPPWQVPTVPAPA